MAEGNIRLTQFSQQSVVKFAFLFFALFVCKQSKSQLTQLDWILISIPILISGQELNAIWLGQFCGYYMQENIAKFTASTNSERESAPFVVQGLDGLPFIAVLIASLNWEGIRVVINLNPALFQ